MSNNAIITMTLGDHFVFSLTPEASDYLPNYLILDQINCSLFKINLDGEPVLSAAESYEVSSDSLVWTFVLKKDLRDGYGTELRPSTWINGIKAILKDVKNIETMILLSSLFNWSNFLEGRCDLPIEINDEERTIKFKFYKKPIGIQEYLMMPILSFWSFDEEGKLKATGKYFVANLKKSVITLKVFESFEEEVGINEFTVRSINLTSEQDYHAARNEIIIPSKSGIINPKNTSIVKSTPTWVSFVEINPYRPFINEDLLLQASLYQTLKEAREQYSINENFEFKTTSIFYDCQNHEANEEKVAKKKINTKLKAVTNSSIVQKNNNLASYIVEYIKKNHACEIELMYSDKSEFYLNTILNRDYDIRIGTVDAGTKPGKWVTEMMFCTKQGISFIDKENEIENLIKKIPEESIDEIGRIVNNALSKHKCIVPIFNKAFVVYVGTNIDTKTVSANNSSLRFELIRLVV